jgi:hypothetical protein
MALAWFDATHARDPMTGVWTRTSLPHAGGVGDQDGWLMSALEVLRQAAAVLDHDDAIAHARDADLARWRQGATPETSR